MHKKKKILAFIICLACICIALFFITVTKKYFLPVKCHIENAYTLTSNFEKWNPLIEQLNKASLIRDSSGKGTITSLSYKSDNGYIIVQKNSTLSFAVTSKINKDYNAYEFTILPTKIADSIELYSTEKVNLINLILHKPATAEKDMLALKSYLENEKNIYGYSFTTMGFRDTVFAIKQKVVYKEDVIEELHKSFAELENYVATNNLEKRSFYSASYKPTGDSVELLCGITVNRFAPDNNHVRCVNFPGKKLLTTSYNGKFSERQNLYTAVNKYTLDKLLENVGAPFEVYTNNKLPVNDSSLVSFKFYYPVR